MIKNRPLAMVMMAELWPRLNMRADEANLLGNHPACWVANWNPESPFGIILMAAFSDSLLARGVRGKQLGRLSSYPSCLG